MVSGGGSRIDFDRFFQSFDVERLQLDRVFHTDVSRPGENPEQNLIQAIDLKAERDAAVLVRLRLLRVMPGGFLHDPADFGRKPKFHVIGLLAPGKLPTHSQGTCADRSPGEPRLPIKAAKGFKSCNPERFWGWFPVDPSDDVPCLLNQTQPVRVQGQLPCYRLIRTLVLSAELLALEQRQLGSLDDFLMLAVVCQLQIEDVNQATGVCKNLLDFLV